MNEANFSSVSHEALHAVVLATLVILLQLSIFY